MKHIIIVGGGAGGLELATKLGKKLGKKGKARITLVDKNRTHLWKPLLHEVATGSLDAGIDALSYRSHAANHGFEFQLGQMIGLNRAEQTINLAAMVEDGIEVMPERTLHYDSLVMAIGSISNDFATPGIKEHCIFLDNPSSAHLFHKKMLNQFLKLSTQPEAQQRVNIAIVGAGATGVELSAELFNAAEQLKKYGVPHVSPERLSVTLVEAGDRILPALPDRISSAAHFELSKMGVDVRTKTMITQATKQGLSTKADGDIPADLMVWAAGIKCPDFMANLDGLESNRINQLVINDTLQTTRDENIFALGDCASLMQSSGRPVPPRAQAAHQMASHLYRNILAKLEGKALRPYHYNDYGSLVSLSNYSTVGSLMGNLVKGSMTVEGRIARIMYISLYRMHQVALHGLFKTGLIMLVGRINQVLRPKLKLH